MILNEYNNMIREYFDFSDRQTTQFIKYINESDQQSQLLTALAGALYEKIVEKCDKIDFGSIPRSRGDITKIDGYNNTVECINIIRRIVTEYKEDPSIVDIELTALENVKALRPVFMKAFNNNASFPMMYYNLVVASIQHSVSFLIAVAVQFVKDPDNKNIHMALDKAAYKDAESNMVLEQLAQFNKAYASGELEKLLREATSGIRESVEGDEFTEETISTTDDVTDAIEKAPEAESTPIGDDELNEDVTIIRIAGGENEIEIEKPEENEEEEATPEEPAGEEGENNPTLNDDEPETTPTMPINGCDVPMVQQPVDEKSAAKHTYIKHPSADMGIGESFGDTVVAVANKLTDNINGANGNLFKGVLKTIPVPAKIFAYLAGSIGAIYFVLKVVIPGLRNIVAYFWAAKADLSETLAIQANLIELNALELEADQNSNLTDEKKAKVVEKQLKIAQKLRAWAEKVAIKDKKVTKEAKKAIDDEKKKNKISDIKDQLPDDIANDSDLF